MGPTVRGAAIDCAWCAAYVVNFASSGWMSFNAVAPFLEDFSGSDEFTHAYNAGMER